MDLVFDSRKKEEIKNKKEIIFSGSPGYYLVVISARVKGKQQLSKEATDDEDLTVKIDGKTFPKLNDKNRLIDSPASFSGGTLHNLLKTVYFVVALSSSKHSVILETDQLSNTASLESLVIYRLNLEKTFKLDIQTSAEDGDRRPWITLTLDNLPLGSVTTTVTYSHRKQDSDDVKIIIDDHIQENLLKSIKHFLWHFAGSLLSKDSSKTETETFTVNLPQSLHYIEFWADRMPTLENVLFDFGTQPQIPKRIPTVDDPEWTKDFNDDTEEILLARLILGEAERQSKQAKIGIGFTVLNRLKKKNLNWGYNVREIILKENQYDGMWNKSTYTKARDPFSDSSKTRKIEWEESYEVAVDVLSGKLLDPANGATNFHSYENSQMFPPWATEKTFKIKLGNIYFYELER
ncbi:MAG: cell wall hydrolase [Candidatus Daviesbacteria bacterium]|nr:cell wall hydrolase [Candidatus Daviesbacteria bacterium]